MQTQQVLSMSTNGVVASNSNDSMSNAATSTVTNNVAASETTVASVSTETSSTSGSNEQQNISVAQNDSTVSAQNNAVGTMSLEIATVMNESSASEADLIADQIIAQNIQVQKEQIEQEQQETGEYADSSQLVALMNYVPGFNNYSMVSVPDATSWYESTQIYANASLSDNNRAFSNMFGNNLTTMRDMVQSQPKL